MAPLDLFKFTALVKHTSGSPEVKIRLIGGHAVIQHPDLAGEHLCEIPCNNDVICTQANSTSCLHGAFVVDPSPPMGGTPIEIPTLMSHPNKPLVFRGSTALILSVLMLLYGSAFAEDKTWVGGGGIWDSDDNWLPIGKPSSGSTVRINDVPLVKQGALAASSEARLGYLPNSGGGVDVTGPGAIWSNAGVIYAGNNTSSSGHIKAELGGTINTGGLVLANGALSTASLSVIGAGSVMDAGTLTVGFNGVAKMTLQDGGQVNSNTRAYVGYNTGSEGEFRISGAGSRWEQATDIYVGYGGEGTLLIEDGGAMTSTDVTIGGGVAGTSDRRTGQGFVTVAGTGSSWVSSGSLVIGSHLSTVGAGSKGILRVIEGASYSAASTAFVGLEASGTVTVDGPGSTWTAGGAFDSYIGADGEGLLTVFNGGTAIVNSRALRMGLSSTSTGRIEVSGAGSLLQSAGTIQVGNSGTAEMIVNDGGTIIAPRVNITSRAVGGGVFIGNSVILSGGETPESRGVLQTAGIDDGGNLTFDGGVLRASASQTDFITPFSLQPLSTTFRGAFIDTNGFDVGFGRAFSGAGGLTKQGGGTLNLRGASTYLGSTTVEQGILQLANHPFASGDNRLPTNTALVIGNEADIGTATFNLNEFNQTIGSLSSLGTSMPRIVTNTGVALKTLTVNQSIDTVFAGQITGNVSLDKLGTGTLTLAGANTLAGITSVNGGTLEIDGSITGSVIVGADGVLGGSGSVGAITVQEGGIFSPGHSPGALDVSGDLLLAPGSTYLVDLNGSNPGTEYDQTRVSGRVSLDGAILLLVFGFTPSAGETFGILENDGTDPIIGSFSGLAEGEVFTAEGRSFVISYLGGTGNDIFITSPVPLPGSVVMFLSGLLMIMGRRRIGISVPATQ